MKTLVLAALFSATLLLSNLANATAVLPQERDQHSDPPRSHFLLYKNSPFTPCTANDTPFPIPFNSSLPLTPHTSHTRSPTSFCRAIHPPSVLLPTALSASSFLPSWPATLIHVLSILFSYLTLLRSYDDAASSSNGGGEKPPPPYLLSLVPLAIFDAGRLVFWWVELFRAVKTLQAAKWLSVILWVVPGFWWNQMIASGVGKAWVFLAGTVTVAQMAASLGVIAVRWTHRDASTWNYLPMDLSPLGLAPECQPPNLPNEIFADPRVAGARALQTVQFLLVTVGFVTRLDVGSARFPVMARRHGLATFFVGTMVLSAMGLGIAGGAAGLPFRYTTGRCQVAVVMMDAKFGFFDAEFMRASRVVGALFGVY
ncbi:MAG: hypothetical protein M1839_009574 [Geoglossum umbratile]|nr:MAG: hypothetical protein M1839_009574 [Geoglossum umbratile]